MLRTARAALLLACCSATATPAREATVDWRDAVQCVGRVCAISGTVALSENDGPTIRLYFDPQRRDVRVLLMRGWLVTWPRYDGETIVAEGKVERFRDHVEMTILDPRNVTVLAPVSSVPASAPPPPAPPDEAEELRQRVRELEQRIDELEGR